MTLVPPNILYIISACSPHENPVLLMSRSIQLWALPVRRKTVGTMKFKTFDSNGDQRVVTLDGVYNVSHQPQNRVTVEQMTRYVNNQRYSQGFKYCVRYNRIGHSFVFEDAR